MSLMETIASRKIRVFAFLCVATYLCLALLLYVQSAHLIIVDEQDHVSQIALFFNGHWQINARLTMIPGYHLLMAGIAHLFNFGLAGLRATGPVFGLVAACAFYGVRKHLGDAHAARSAALLLFLPILFPYYFLIYTDVLSVALVLTAAWATLKGRHVLASAILVACVLVRQNNVIWALFLATVTVWPQLKTLVRDRIWPFDGTAIRTVLPYGLPVGLVAAFWALNGSLSLSKGQSELHPDLTFHLGNIYFALLLYLILFPAEAWRGARQFVSMTRRTPWLIFIPPALMLFANIRGNAYNYFDPEHFFHNAIMYAIRGHIWALAAFASLTAIAACSLCHTRFLLPHGWLVYPFACAYLSASWLVETRYSIVPIALWMALRRNAPDRDERITLVAWMATSSYLTYSIVNSHFLL